MRGLGEHFGKAVDKSLLTTPVELIISYSFLTRLNVFLNLRVEQSRNTWKCVVISKALVDGIG